MACEELTDLPSLMPGWGCCRCRGYNGPQNDRCRACGHQPCGAVDRLKLAKIANALAGYALVDLDRIRAQHN